MFPFFSVALPATQPPKKCSLLCLLNDRRTNLNKNTTDPGPSPASTPLHPVNSTSKTQTVPITRKHAEHRLLLAAYVQLIICDYT